MYIYIYMYTYEKSSFIKNTICEHGIGIANLFSGMALNTFREKSSSIVPLPSFSVRHVICISYPGVDNSAPVVWYLEFFSFTSEMTNDLTSMICNNYSASLFNQVSSC